MSQSVSFDEGFEAPEFHSDGLHKKCLNTAKGAHINGNDTNCTCNCEKLWAECERLSEIAKKKNTIINQRRKEYERFMREKKNFEDEKKKAGGDFLGGGNDREKDAEIAYLEAQLRKKEEENKKLTKDLERVILEQKETLEKMRDADNAFIGQNSSQLNRLQDEISVLKRENQVLEFKLERSEVDKKEAVADAVRSQQVQASRVTGGPNGEITQEQLKAAINETYDIEKKVYYAFNKDLKKRLNFIANLIEWDEWADVLIDGEDRKLGTNRRGQRAQNTPRVKDGELANEHWAASKSELSQMMMKVYFPVIDIQEHD